MYELLCACMYMYEREREYTALGARSHKFQKFCAALIFTNDRVGVVGELLSAPKVCVRGT